MRKLELPEIPDAIERRDRGELRPAEYAPLAVALDEQLRVTILRSQEAKQIEDLLRNQALPRPAPVTPAPDRPVEDPVAPTPLPAPEKPESAPTQLAA